MLPESEQRLSARRREAGEIRGFMVGAAAKGEDTAFLAGMTAPVRSRLTLTDKIMHRVPTTYKVLCLSLRRKRFRNKWCTEFSFSGVDGEDGLKAFSPFTFLH